MVLRCAGLHQILVPGRECGIMTMLKLGKIVSGPAHKLLSGFNTISDVYGSFIRNKTTFTKYCLTQWISELPRRFEIHWVSQVSGMTNRLISFSNVMVFSVTQCNRFIINQIGACMCAHFHHNQFQSYLIWTSAFSDIMIFDVSYLKFVGIRGPSH